MRALYCLSFGPKKEYVETDFKPVEYRLGTTLIAFLSTDFASLRAKLLVRTTPMMENQAITEIKNALSAIHPFGERFVQSLFFEEKLADVLDERMEGFEKLQKELSAFADAVLVPDRSKLSAKQRLALYMSHDFQAATAIAGLDLKMRAERKLYVDEQNFDPVLAADRISTPPKSVRFARIEGSDDLGATLLTELLEMVEQGIELKKCEYCHRYFIPFSSKEEEVFNNPFIYQINTPQSYLYSEVYEHFTRQFPDANIIILEATAVEKDKTEFIKGLKQELSNKGISVKTLSESATAQNMKEVLRNDKENIFIPTSGSDVTLIKIIPQLTMLVRENPDVNIHLFGYPEWQTYTKNHLDSFFELDTYFYSSFYTNNMLPAAINFINSYHKWYSKDMTVNYPQYGMLGFDTGFFFLKGLAKYGAKIIPAKDSDDCIEDADLIITVTPSAKPVFDGTKVKAGATISCVGTYEPHKHELDPAVLPRASKIICDSKEAALSETGDLLIPIAEGIITEEDVLGSLGDVINGKIKGRENDEEIIVYETVGVAAQDLVAAKVIYDKAVEAGKGLRWGE